MFISNNYCKEENNCNGLHISYSDSTKQITYSNYKKGKKHGVELILFEDGSIATTGKYKNGMKHGWFTYYLSDGQLAGKQKYKKGVETKSVTYNTNW